MQLIQFTVAQEWLSVTWVTIGLRRGSELFANKLMGTSSGESSLLHLLVFQERLSVQCGYTMEYQLFLVLPLQKLKCDKGEYKRRIQSHKGKCLCLSIHWKYLQKAALRNSNRRPAGADCMWQPPQVEIEQSQHKTPWQLIIYYLVLVGLQPCLFFSSLGYFRTTGTYVSL